MKRVRRFPQSIDAWPSLDALLGAVRACRACEAHLPLGPRPVLQAQEMARILVVGQAPGLRVHETGIPWNDASGERLRAWMGIDPPTFYDASRIAIVPMGYCYPGRGSGGDLPPRPECAPLWRDRLLAGMPAIRLTLLVGSYAQINALGPGRVSQRVRDFRSYLPRYFPLPHPSWRSRIWAENNPWFSSEVPPALRNAVARALEAD